MPRLLACCRGRLAFRACAGLTLSVVPAEQCWSGRGPCCINVDSHVNAEHALTVYKTPAGDRCSIICSEMRHVPEAPAQGDRATEIEGGWAMHSRHPAACSS